MRELEFCRHFVESRFAKKWRQISIFFYELGQTVCFLEYNDGMSLKTSPNLDVYGHFLKLISLF